METSAKTFRIVNVMILTGILTAGFVVTCTGFFVGLKLFNVKLGVVFPGLLNFM